MLTIKFSVPDGRRPLESSFSNVATVRTAKDFIAKVLVACPDNISLIVNGSSPSDQTPLMRIPERVFHVVLNPSRVFRFWDPRGNVIELPFKDTATVADAKNALSPKMRAVPELIDLQVNGQSLDDDFMLLDLGQQGNTSIHIHTFSAEEEDELEYLFLVRGEGVSIPLKKSATVNDAIQNLTRYAPDSKSIALSFDGNPLKDLTQLLTELKVPRGEFIMVETDIFQCTELRNRHAGRPLFSRSPSRRSSGTPDESFDE